MLPDLYPDNPTNRPFSEPATNYSYPFRQWLGFALTRGQKHLIEQIERHRRRNADRIDALISARRFFMAEQPTRIFVDDDGSQGDTIRRILILYLTWLSQQVTPDCNSLLAARTKRQARELLPDAHRPQLRRNLLLGSARTPNNIRGQWLHNALLLDCDTYGRCTRYAVRDRHPASGLWYIHRTRAQAYDMLTQAVIGALPMVASSMLIIHGNPGRHPRRIYARHRRQADDAIRRGHTTPYIILSARPPAPQATIAADHGQSPPTLGRPRRRRAALPRSVRNTLRRSHSESAATTIRLRLADLLALRRRHPHATVIPL